MNHDLFERIFEENLVEKEGYVFYAEIIYEKIPD